MKAKGKMCPKCKKPYDKNGKCGCKEGGKSKAKAKSKQKWDDHDYS